MDRLTWMLTRMLRDAARLLPSARREWAEAVRAEADLVPAGWPRVGWLAGGLWLAVKEAEIMRKVVYWLGIGAVAAAAGWAVWLSWHTSPAADALTVTDRVRVLVGVAALALLPWVGRRHDRPARRPGPGPGYLRAEYPGRSLRRPADRDHDGHHVPAR